VRSTLELVVGKGVLQTCFVVRLCFGHEKQRILSLLTFGANHFFSFDAAKLTHLMEGNNVFLKVIDNLFSDSVNFKVFFSIPRLPEFTAYLFYHIVGCDCIKDFYEEVYGHT